MRPPKPSAALDRQRAALNCVAAAGPAGLTWNELSAKAGFSADQATRALSVLHREGDIARLLLRRSRSSVYVLPRHVKDRAVAEHINAGREGRTDAGLPIRPSTGSAGGSGLRISVGEDQLIQNLREGIGRLPRDRPIVPMRVESVRILLNIIDRAAKGR